MSQDIERLKKLILFITEYCKDKPNFGSTHLNKILYFSDFIHFKFTGESISGAEYFKLEAGPAPKLLVPAREQLIAGGLLEIQEKATLGGYTQKRPVPTQPIDDTFLTEAQKQFVRGIADQACGMTASILSDITHKQLAWQLADLKQTIPLFTIHCTQVNPITASSEAWARQLLKQQKAVA